MLHVRVRSDLEQQSRLNLTARLTAKQLYDGGPRDRRWSNRRARQLEAGWVRDADAFENTGDEPVNQMKVVDAIYRASGLEPRTGPAGIAAKL